MYLYIPAQVLDLKNWILSDHHAFKKWIALVSYVWPFEGNEEKYQEKKFKTMVQMTYVNLYSWTTSATTFWVFLVLIKMTDKNAIFYVGVELQNKIKYHDGE